ncbi:hypothetical protein FRC12_003252 [Ceratobasidium sp. 428]|nr:hypothetical protein FRC12_003252 [Ceratobasidium sp. 428]
MSSTEDTEPGTSKYRPSKRIRKSRQDSEAPAQSIVKRARGKQGGLQGLMNMPIEVFTEISKYLYPLDLILLSRANKFFRRLLMSRSAIQTWRYALSNVPGLPPCPMELCEPQYAALVFSKNCSMCGKQALRPMDPVLQVRLCVSCRDQEVQCPVNSVYGLVPTSTTLVPQKGGHINLCCLRKDLDAYHSEYDAVKQANGHDAALRWAQKRRQEIIARLENAAPLIQFVEMMEEEQSNDLTIRKLGRQVEIESRLLKLGWENGDFIMREKAGEKKWKSLACIAKPLTERDWEKILPQLTVILEHTRKLRLEHETSARKYTRKYTVLEWLSKTFREMEPYARVLDDDRRENINQAQEDLYLALRYTEANQEMKHASKQLKAPYPGPDQVTAWDPFKLLVDTDVPMEDFELHLARIRPTLDTLLLEWRLNLERDLAKLLPANMDSIAGSPESATSTLGTNITATARPIPDFTILVGGEPAGNLPSDTQKLLRADAIFHRANNTAYYYHYPEDFAYLRPTLSNTWHFNVEASKVAKALLINLGNPNATYLQLKAAGPAFSCGRCVSRNCTTWREMVCNSIV